VELYLHSPSVPSWHGAQLKHRQNFWVYLYLKREKVSGSWRRGHNEELCKLCASSDIIRVNKS
jgi:hypothetical protein